MLPTVTNTVITGFINKYKDANKNLRKERLEALGYSQPDLASFLLNVILVHETNAEGEEILMSEVEQARLEGYVNGFLVCFGLIDAQDKTELFGDSFLEPSEEYDFLEPTEWEPDSDDEDDDGY